MVGNHRTIYNESLIYLSLKLNLFFIKSEPILQNEPIRILYPFRSSFTKKGLSQMLIIKRMAQPFAMKYCY